MINSYKDLPSSYQSFDITLNQLYVSWAFKSVTTILLFLIMYRSYTSYLYQIFPYQAWKIEADHPRPLPTRPLPGLAASHLWVCGEHFVVVLEVQDTAWHQTTSMTTRPTCQRIQQVALEPWLPWLRPWWLLQRKRAWHCQLTCHQPLSHPATTFDTTAVLCPLRAAVWGLLGLWATTITSA